MKIDCLIVDDEPVARNIIKSYCGHLPFINIAGECGNALDAKAFMADHPVDLLFLDINMPVLNGISFLGTLKNPPQVILTTAYQEYALNAFDLAVCDYLLKPFSLGRFIVAVDKAKEKLQQIKVSVKGTETSPGNDDFFVRSEGKTYKLNPADCLYAEARGNYTKIVTTTGVISTKMPCRRIFTGSPVVRHQ
jgi:DNA-binding LytR/AlgR family response regulator